MRPSEFPEFRTYSLIHDFVKENVDMQFDDVRTMLRLVGCNFAATAILCNIISGISVILYTTNIPNKARGKRFKELLMIFYPWEPCENRTEKIGVLYDLIRNPLAHSLGILEDTKYQITLRKSPLKEEQIEEIERSDIRPVWVPQVVSGSSKKYDVSVEGLYWGVFHLLKRLSGDVIQMCEAEKRIK